MYNVLDIGWLYAKSTGAIPYIVNNDGTKVKNIADGTILDLNEKDRFTPYRVLERYYEIPHNIVYSSKQIMTNYLNTWEWLFITNGQRVDEATLSDFQVKMMKKCFERKLNKLNRKKDKIAKRQEMDDAQRQESKEF